MTDTQDILKKLLTADGVGIIPKQLALLDLLSDPGLIFAARQALTPAPGSPDARAMGCRCPVLDNQELAGTGRRIVLSTCALHWPKERR